MPQLNKARNRVKLFKASEDVVAYQRKLFIPNEHKAAVTSMSKLSHFCVRIDLNTVKLLSQTSPVLTAKVGALFFSPHSATRNVRDCKRCTGNNL